MLKVLLISPLEKTLFKIAFPIPSDWLLINLNENASFTKEELKELIDGTPAMPYEMVVCAIGDLFALFPEFFDRNTTRDVCDVSSSQ